MMGLPVRTTVDSIVVGDGSVAIDLGENETTIASVEDGTGRMITCRLPAGSGWRWLEHQRRI